MTSRTSSDFPDQKCTLRVMGHDHSWERVVLALDWKTEG